jgi:hypothetical protein
MGANFERRQDFCREHNLEVSKRYSPSAVSRYKWYVNAGTFEAAQAAIRLLPADFPPPEAGAILPAFA